MTSTDGHPQETRGPLSGFVVVELGNRIGAAVCGSVLAQFGATVVTVESAQDAALDTKLLHRVPLAAGKLSFAPADDGDARTLVGLLGRSDVVITSSDIDCHRTGAERFPETAIVCDVTAFGSSGPMAGLGWSDLQIQALTGVLDATGEAGAPPCPIGIPLVEHVAGLYAAGAVLCALRLRRLANVPQSIEIALYDVGFSLMTSFLPVLLSGEPHGPVSRVGNRQTMVAPWNVYRARDGWLLLCAGSDEQWRRICRIIGRDELGSGPGFTTAAERLANVAEVDAIVGGWVAGRHVRDCVEAFGAASIPCGPIATIDGHPVERNLLHRGMIHETRDPASGRDVHLPGSPFRMSRSPGRASSRIPPVGGDREAVERLVRSAPVDPPQAERAAAGPPLAGLRVLEIGHYTTAPLAARHLANLGAEVVKIEPPGGEAVRGWPPARAGQGIFFSFQNADKKSVVLDIEDESGRAKLAALIRGADVLIENLKPGALRKRGFGPDEILALNPGIVYCAVSGFGSDSLYAGRPAFDAVIQAMSGLMDVTEAGDEPMKTGPSSADVMGAAAAFVAIVAALEHRDATGEGQHIDLSMQDLGAWATQCAWNRAGSPKAAADIVRAVDGFVLVETGPRPGDPDATGPAATSTRQTVVERLDRHGIRAAQIRTAEEVVHADQTAARRLWFVAQEDGVCFPLLASPLRLRLTPATVTRPGPRLGRDTEAILGRGDLGSRLRPAAHE